MDGRAFHPDPPLPNSVATYAVAPATLYTAYLKRIFDVCLSVLLIVLLLSWVTLLLALLIPLGSRGPLFFIQTRTGLRGRHFACIKFRTMRQSDQRDTAQATHDDARITPIGRFLRATHIDELPQLINVLRNEMSIVGPRPHMLCHDLLFTALVPAYPQRHALKPGITGLAQATGYHGATPHFRSISNRTRLDLFYVRRVSFLLDLRILLTTVFIVPAKYIQRAYADGH